MFCGDPQLLHRAMAISDFLPFLSGKLGPALCYSHLDLAKKGQSGYYPWLGRGGPDSLRQIPPFCHIQFPSVRISSPFPRIVPNPCQKASYLRGQVLLRLPVAHLERVKAGGGVAPRSASPLQLRLIPCRPAVDL